MSRTCHDCIHSPTWWECTYPWPEGWEPEDKEYDELEAETCIHFERKPETPPELYQPSRSISDLYQETYNLIMAEEF